MKKNILVVAAHPDDEVLGCGGAMAKHALSGDRVHVLILGEGVTSRGASRESGRNTAKLSQLAKSAHEANRLLGVKSVKLVDFPDNRFDSVDLLDIVKAIESVKKEVHPEIIYTHYGQDVNVDHRRVHEAVLAACRPLPGETVKTLLFFEVASSTEWRPPTKETVFMPNWFVDISQTLPRKMKALKKYSSEMRPWPHARSLKALEHLAGWRGATIGVQAAEAFMLGRNIKKAK